MNPNSLRVALLHAAPLDAVERRGLHALFLRADLLGRLVPPEEASVVVTLGNVDWSQIPKGTPTVRIPLHQRTIDSARVAALLRSPAAKLEALGTRSLDVHGTTHLTLGVNLPALFADILSPEVDSGRELDEHGRVAPRANLLYRLGLMERPVLDELARAFLAAVASLAGQPVPAPPAWSFCATFDIDSDGVLPVRRFGRNLLRLGRIRPRAIPTFLADVALAAARLRIDPEIRLRELGEQLDALHVPATFLVQVRRLHRLDSYRLRAGSRLLAQLNLLAASGVHRIGLHSSYATSNRSTHDLQRQWIRLRKVLGAEVVEAVHRSHYLRTRDAAWEWNTRLGGPLVDSSLGFGNVPGFRRGTCHPFATAQNVIEQPLVAMDSTYLYHRREKPAQAFEHIMDLAERVRRVGGVFVLVMHPHHFHEASFPGWHDLLFDVVRECRRRGAQFQALADAALGRYCSESASSHPAFQDLPAP